MTMAELVVVLTAVLLLSVAANEAVYNVGDGAGWTTIGNVDYKKWAATKTFRVSDVIVFKYNAQFHNVMQVSHDGYRACNASKPIATHTTGNDTITITKYGHYFFLCGVPGHCQAGQKVDIHVPRLATSSPAPSPSVASVAPSPTNPVASAVSPGPSSAAAMPVTPFDSVKGLFSVIAAAMLSYLF